MQKKGYDLLSWIFLVVIIVLFTYNLYLVNSIGSDFGGKNLEAMNSENISEIREKMNENMDDFAKSQTPKIAMVSLVKYFLYALGAIYSIIIFILCFKLKIGTLEKLIVLIGGILTYGGLALLVYFFDVRKKFDGGGNKASKWAMYIGAAVVLVLGAVAYFFAMNVCPDLLDRTPEVCDGFLPFLVFISPGLFILILAVIFHILYNKRVR